MKRTASWPTSSTTSRKVTKSPLRLDIFTGSPLRKSFTSWTILTSSDPLPDVVAFTGRLEQQLLAVFPILDRRAFRRRQAAFIDVALGLQEVDGLGDLVVSG